MIDSVTVPWGNGEKRIYKHKVEKILKFNADKQLKLLLYILQCLYKKWQRTFCIMDQRVYFSGELKFYT